METARTNPKDQLGFGRVSLRVISCIPKQAKPKDGKEGRQYYLMYLQVPTGEVGEAFSDKHHAPDTMVSMTIGVRDGKFTCRLIEE